jgi:DNA-binding transcriptional LysR family regulator
MAIDSNDLVLFAQVVDAGSFNGAAQRARLPNSTVSRRIAMLETQLGERLLLRTTRKLTVTDFGASMLEHARQVASELEAAELLAQHRRAEPSGRLRISMPNDMASGMLAPMLAQFILRYPSIAVEIDLTPRRVDLIGENFDLAIRAGNQLEDSGLSARRLASFSAALYASPQYLARRGMPAEPADLMRHDALHLLGRDSKPVPWLLTRGEDRWEGTPPSRAAINSPDVLFQLACADAGIAILPDHLLSMPGRNGALVPVLPDWSVPAFSAWAVFPGRRLMPQRTRVFLDAMEAHFSSPACQEHMAQAEQAKSERLAALPAKAADALKR